MKNKLRKTNFDEVWAMFVVSSCSEALLLSREFVWIFPFASQGSSDFRLFL
jgi:hypothetical protein